MFSLGITISCLLTGDLFSTHEERCSQSLSLLSMQAQRRFTYKSPQPTELVNSLIAEDAEARPTATEVLAHPWFHMEEGLSVSLDDCEHRATRNWRPRTDSSALVEDLPDFAAEETKDATDQMTRPLKSPACPTKSPYFRLPQQQSLAVDFANAQTRRLSQTCRSELPGRGNRIQEVVATNLFQKTTPVCENLTKGVD